MHNFAEQIPAKSGRINYAYKVASMEMTPPANNVMIVMKL